MNKDHSKNPQPDQVPDDERTGTEPNPSGHEPKSLRAPPKQSPD